MGAQVALLFFSRPSANMAAAMKPAMKAAMKKAMKAMKAKKVMKAMKAMKVSKIAKGKRAKSAVFAGTKEKTSGGLSKDKLTKNKQGKVVSKAASSRSKNAWANSGLKKWSDATKQARKELNIKGFCVIGGSTAQGKALLAKVRSIVGKKR